MGGATGAEGAGMAGTAGEGCGAWMMLPQEGQGPVTPAMLAGTVSLVAHAGQKKVKVGATISFAETNRRVKARQ